MIHGFATPLLAVIKFLIQGSVEAVGFCATHPWVATGATDGSLKVWDSVSGSCRHSCSHPAPVTRLGWHPAAPVRLSGTLVYRSHPSSCIYRMTVRAVMEHQFALGITEKATYDSSLTNSALYFASSVQSGLGRVLLLAGPGSIFVPVCVLLQDKPHGKVLSWSISVSNTLVYTPEPNMPHCLCNMVSG